MKNKTILIIVIAFSLVVIAIEYALIIGTDGRFQNLLLLPVMYSGLMTFAGVWWSISENRRILHKQKIQAARPFLQIIFDNLSDGVSRICDQYEIGKGEKRNSIFIKCATGAPFVWKAYQVNDEEQKFLEREITIAADIWSEIYIKRDWKEIRLQGTDCYAKEYCFIITETGIFPL